MKNLTKISLHNLGQAELAKREENLLRGGAQCACAGNAVCGCLYAGGQSGSNDHYYGGVDTNTNNVANFDEQVTNVNHSA